MKSRKLATDESEAVTECIKYNKATDAAPRTNHGGCVETVDVRVETVCEAVVGCTKGDCAIEKTTVDYSHNFDTFDRDSATCILGE